MARTPRVVAVAAVVLLAAGCDAEAEPSGGGEEKGYSAHWYQIADEARLASTDPEGTIPQVDLAAPCRVPANVSVAGQPAKPNGAGAARFGASGVIYLCQFTEPSSSLTVARMSDAAEFAEATADLAAPGAQGGSKSTTMVPLDDRTFTVIRTTYPTNSTHIDYEAHYLDRAQNGIVTLRVETTATRGLIDSYDDQAAATDLDAVLG